MVEEQFHNCTFSVEWTSLVKCSLLHLHLSILSHISVHRLHYLHNHHFHQLSLFQSFILTLRLGSLAILSTIDLFFTHDSMDSFDRFYSAQRLDLFAWCVQLSRLSVGFWTHFKFIQFHSFIYSVLFVDYGCSHRHSSARWHQNLSHWYHPSTKSLKILVTVPQAMCSLSCSDRNWKEGIASCAVLLQMFVELDELRLGDNQEWAWQEKARWIKFEEEIEEGALRWGKPHVSSLSFHSLLELRRCLEQGPSVFLSVSEIDIICCVCRAGVNFWCKLLHCPGWSKKGRKINK